MTTKQPQKQKQLRRTRLREWRVFRGLSQKALAERIDMTHGTLSLLERGLRGYSQDTMERIAHALQTDVPSLLSRDPNDNASLWEVWDKALPAEKAAIVQIAKTVVGTRAQS